MRRLGISRDFYYSAGRISVNRSKVITDGEPQATESYHVQPHFEWSFEMIYNDILANESFIIFW